MIADDWIEHRRGDRERVGWMVADGDGFQVVDLLGRPRTDDPIEWLDAEQLLADRYTLTLDDGTVRSVRIGEVSPDGINVVADDWGSASAVGSKPEVFRLPFPAPDALQPAQPSALDAKNL